MNKKVSGRFDLTKQLLLLTSRCDLDEEDFLYVQELVNSPEVDWAFFLGTACLNRINGVVYGNLLKVSGIPQRVEYFLRIAYNEHSDRNALHQKEIFQISEKLNEYKIKHAFMKGAVLNTVFYEPGQRISNDTDIMVSTSDLEKVTTILTDLGYFQGKVEDGVLRKATKKEILFAKLNTYEITPFFKIIDDRKLPFHCVDVNYRLSNEDSEEGAEKMLNDTIILEKGPHCIRTFSLETFLLFLCVHHHREAIMVAKIVYDDDMTLYKYMDIHFFITKKKNDIDWEKMSALAKEINKVDSVYHTLYYTEVFFPLTIPEDVFKLFTPSSELIVDQYKGRDNTSEVYTWEQDLYLRTFSVSRRIEAFEKIKEENDRFSDICKLLKED